MSKHTLDRIIGIDIGGTKTAAGLMNPVTGEVIKTVRGATPRGGNPVLIEAVVNLVDRLLEQMPGSISGIGVGIPGNVDRQRGVALSAGNLDFRDMPISTCLQERFNIPVYLENDANAGVLGEKWFGEGKHFRNFIYMAIGTGIGGGMVLNGQLYLGKGYAGEVGHTVIDPTRSQCYCGLPGCLESLASGGAIGRNATARLQEGGDGVLREAWQRGEQITGEDVVRAAKLGDSLALDVMEEVGRYLAYGLISMARLLDPEAIILGGGVSEAQDLLKEVILAGAPSSGTRSNLEKIMHFSTLSSGMAGAAAVVLERRNE